MIGALRVIGGPLHGGMIAVEFGAPWAPCLTTVVTTPDGPCRVDYILCGSDGRVWYGFVEAGGEVNPV